MLNINKLSKEVFEWAKSIGWWDDMNRCPFQTLQLFSTEVAEATEGERKSLMDDKLTHRPMGEVELADVVIRAVDMGGRYGWKYISGVSTVFHYGTKTIGAMHLSLNKTIIMLADMIVKGVDLNNLEEGYEIIYSKLIVTCYVIAEKQGYDLDGAIFEKLEFNRHRADHKRENRQGEEGQKAF